LRFFWRYVSRIADGPFYVLLGLVVASCAPQGRHYLLASLLAFALELPLYKLLKKAFHRSRPFVTLPDAIKWIVPPDEFSFPSGHTAGACLMAVVVSAFFPMAGSIMIVFAMGVGYSRVALGVHYPGDVLAGAFLGGLCACVGLAGVGML
jgi:undecaprenyl-diphosphatase